MSKSYSAIYAFGDSLSDAGNDSIATSLIGQIPVSPPYYQTSVGPFGLLPAAVFSNGPIFVQDLATRLGLSAVTPSLAGGNDFAYGGAQANTNLSTVSGFGSAAISIASQLVQFEAGGGGPSSALYTLSIGTNDIVSIVGESGVDYAKMTGQVADSVSSEMSFISHLAGDGASNLLVIDVPDVGTLPVITKHQSSSEDALATQLSNLYNVDLNAQLETFAQGHGINLEIMPLFSLSDQAIVSPSTFGLSDVTDPAWTGNFTSSSSGTVAASPNTYLFWDQYHPTAHVQDLIAADAQSLVTSGTQLYSAPTLQVSDVTSGLASTQFGTVAEPGATQAGQFIYTGLDTIAMRANTSSMTLEGGQADIALQAIGGSNVLQAGARSSFLVGATGGDGGADLFYTDTNGVSAGWDTLVNFHTGDKLAIWGYNSGSSFHWTGVDGAAGYTGATLTADVNGVDRNVTFAGLSLAQAQNLPTLTGSLGGQSFLLFYNPGV